MCIEGQIRSWLVNQATTRSRPRAPAGWRRPLRLAALGAHVVCRRRRGAQFLAHDLCHLSVCARMRMHTHIQVTPKKQIYIYVYACAVSGPRGTESEGPGAQGQ